MAQFLCYHLFAPFWLSIFLSRFVVHAQDCFYPNGDLSTEGDGPCSSEPGSACCPLNWECLSNGLCYNPDPSLQWYGRYTCTDRTWQSSNCPQICTHNGTAGGNEAVLECSSGSYCCDANRPDIDNPPQLGCCETSESFFSLPDGNVISSIGNVPSVTPVGSNAPPPTSAPSSSPVSMTTSPPSSTPKPSSTPTPTTLTPATSPTTSPTPKSSTTPSSPSTSHLTETAIPLPLSSSTMTSPSSPATTTPTSSESSTGAPSSTQAAAPSHLAAVVGPAVGVPVGVCALAGFVFLMWRHRRSNKRKSLLSSPMTDNGEMSGYGRDLGPPSIWVPPQERMDQPGMMTS
ncbi:hypothetical protein MMC18_007877 [Xylographa bjoerkii]|nr:hypothetical protein [Xylographa bjoerkii]